MGGMWLWWILGIALIAAVVWLVARAGREGGGSTTESPEAVLKRRYANGEIEREEYERRLADLRK